MDVLELWTGSNRAEGNATDQDIQAAMAEMAARRKIKWVRPEATAHVWLANMANAIKCMRHRSLTESLYFACNCGERPCMTEHMAHACTGYDTPFQGWMDKEPSTQSEYARAEPPGVEPSPPNGRERKRASSDGASPKAVSYTHLTLPTILLV